MKTFALVFDQRSINSVEALANAVLLFSEPIKGSVEPVKAISHLLHRSAGFEFKIFRTMRTGEYRVTLQFGDRLSEFMAAMNASDGKVEFIDSAPAIAPSLNLYFEHSYSPSGGAAAPALMKQASATASPKRRGR